MLRLERVGKSGTGEVRDWRLAMFKLPAYDFLSILIMGFGIFLLAALAFAF